MIHLPEQWIHRFHDDDAGRVTRGAVVFHLSRCAKCRSVLQNLRDLEAAVRHIADVTPPPALRERVAAGPPSDRVVLPVPDTSKAPNRGFPWRPATAAAVGVVIIGFAIIGNELQAGSSVLRFEVDHNAGWPHLNVVYRDAGHFSREDTVVLRGRLREAGFAQDDARLHRQAVAVLYRTRGGAFVGRFTAPERFVYGAFAVEDGEAETVDDNFSQLWFWPDTLLSFDALEQEYFAWIPVDIERAYAAAHAMAYRFPDDPRGLGYFAASLRTFRDNQAERDEFDYVHGRFARLDEILRDRDDLDVVTAHAMYQLGQIVDPRDPRSLRWMRTVKDRWPSHPLSVLPRLLENPRSQDLYRAVFDELGDRTPDFLVAGAWSLARIMDDPDLLCFWGSHQARRRPEETPTIAPILHRDPSCRDTALQLAQAFAINPLGDSTRQLRETQWAYERRMTTVRAEANGVLGQLLVAAGRQDEGMDLLTDVISRTWSPALHEMLARSFLANGDTLGASTLIGRLLVDPVTASVGVRFKERVARGAELHWEEIEERSRRAMITYTLPRRVGVRSVLGTALRRGDATEVPFDEVVGGQTTVVAYASRFQADLMHLDSLQTLIGPWGVRMIAVFTPPRGGPAPDSPFLASIPTYETSPEATRALGAWGSPQWFVIDAQGRVMFNNVTIQQIPRQVAVLESLRESPRLVAPQ